jgi:hypothetical protein
MANKGTCKAESCDKDVRAKGYCDRHYRKWRKGVMGKARYRSCNEKGCPKPISRKGLCGEHFGRKFGKKKQEDAAEPGSPAPTAAGAPDSAPAGS